MSKKLTRLKDGNKIHFQVDGFESIAADLDVLSEDIVHRLALHGLSQKLGDSAAGENGKEAYDCISSTWEALKAGNWAERAPASPKLNVKSIKEKLTGLSDHERRVALESLAKLGVVIN